MSLEAGKAILDIQIVSLELQYIRLLCHSSWCHNKRGDLHLKCDQRRYLIIIYLPCFILFLLPSDDARETAAAAATSLNVDRPCAWAARRGCIFREVYFFSSSTKCASAFRFGAVSLQGVLAICSNHETLTLGNLWFHKLHLYGHSAKHRAFSSSLVTALRSADLFH